MVTRQEREAADRFAQRYREAPVDVLQAIERTVIGGAWGANGYTPSPRPTSSPYCSIFAGARCSSTSAPGGVGRVCTWLP
jgi:hypothetical protein